MSDLLRIGASGVNAYRSALTVIGDNVANAETPGYVRRGVTLSEAPGAGVTTPYFRGIGTGNGVNAVSVTRAWDAFKAQSARGSAADAGRADARVQWLGAAETSLPDDDSGISAKVTGFFSAATQLAADPTNTLARTSALTALGDAVGAINAGAADLGKVATAVTADAMQTLASVNDSLTSLATLNQAIGRATDGTAGKASLEDQRDALLDDLSAKLGIEAEVASDGTVSVSLAGASGTTLVSGNRAAQIALTAGDDGRLGFAIAGSAVVGVGGRLGGLADAAASVATSRAALDAAAGDFATKLNAWQAKGQTASGATGVPLLAGSTAATLALATSDPAALAAAKDGSANGNIAGLADLRGSDGAEARLTTLVNVNAQALASAKAESAAAGSRRDAAFADRADTSGVDLDREAAELLRYQQAYAGSAKVIQVARETLQSILSLF